jgi:hypothetical protein
VIRCDKRCGFDMRFLQNSYIFCFLTSNSISQPHGERDFAILYTVEMQVWRSLVSLFLFAYKCGYLRALTVYVWSEHPCGISMFLLFLFVLFLLFFFFSLVVGYSLPQGVLASSMRYLFSFKFRSFFAPRMAASCSFLYNA